MSTSAFVRETEYRNARSIACVKHMKIRIYHSSYVNSTSTY